MCHREKSIENMNVPVAMLPVENQSSTVLKTRLESMLTSPFRRVTVSRNAFNHPVLCKFRFQA